MSGLVRQKKVGRLIQKELGGILLRRQRSFAGARFISLLEVQMSPDLGVAKVYVDASSIENKKAILDQLEDSKRELRRELGALVGKQLRIIPELLFFIDETEERALRIERLIRDLHIPPAPPDDAVNA